MTTTTEKRIPNGTAVLLVTPNVPGFHWRRGIVRGHSRDGWYAVSVPGYTGHIGFRRHELEVTQ